MGAYRGAAITMLGIAVGCSGGGGLPFGNATKKSESASSASSSSGETTSTSSTSSSGITTSTERLVIEPADATVFVDTSTTPPVPGTLAYKVKLAGPSGERDLTASAQFRVDDAPLGSFTGPVFTSATSFASTSRVFTTTVHILAEGNSADAKLAVVTLRRNGDTRDFYFQEPYMAAPSPINDVLKFGTKIQKVDVVFTMDTTGSMQGSINNLKSALAGTLVSQLQAEIPSVGMAVADHKDFPVSPYGGAGDYPVAIRQTVTTTASLVTAGVNALGAGGGSDGPESQIAAMHYVLTGEALAWPGGGSLLAHMPPAGFSGGVDFRAGAAAVIIDITDTTWHAGSDTPYSFPSPSMTQLKAAFAASTARFVSITSGPETQANDLSDATGSSVPPAAFGTVAGCSTGQCCTDVSGVGRAATGPGGTCRLNFRHNMGNGVSEGIVRAIRTIAAGSVYDVTARSQNDPANAGGVDAKRFIRSLRAKDEGDVAQGCPPGTAVDTDGDGVKDTFKNVIVGTPVCFEILPAQNDFVPSTESTQSFRAFINVLGEPGDVQLDRREVLFLVPSRDVTTR